MITHPTNAQIARSEDLWNEFYNVNALAENAYDQYTEAERLALLERDYPEDPVVRGWLLEE